MRLLLLPLLSGIRWMDDEMNERINQSINDGMKWMMCNNAINQ